MTKPRAVLPMRDDVDVQVVLDALTEIGLDYADQLREGRDPDVAHKRNRSTHMIQKILKQTRQ